jgi:hypothetical protein
MFFAKGMLMGLLVMLVVVGSAVWMGIDASARDFSGDRFADATWKWVVGGLGLWVVAFPVYLVRRGRVPRKGAGSVAPKVTRGEDPATSGSVAPPSMRPPS